MIVSDATKNKFKEIKEEAVKFHPRWKEICSYFLPTSGSFNDEQPDKLPEIEYLKQIDCDPNAYVMRLAAGLMSGMTNSSREWFALGTDKGVWGETPEEAAYLKKRKERIETRLHKGGVYLTLLKMYMELATVGTYVYLVEKDAENGIRTIPLTIGEAYLGVGPKGKIDTFGRTFYMSPREILAEFGDATPDLVRERALNGKGNGERLAVYQLIEPNNTRIYGHLDASGKAYRSVYWMSNHPHYLRVSGYNHFPVIAPRWDIKHFNSIWGTGPGFVALGTVKSLQKMAADKCLGAELSIKPPVQADASMLSRDVNLKPGGITYRSSLNTSKLEPVFTQPINISAIDQLIMEQKDILSRQFFTDVVLALLANPKSDRTATEVAEISTERLSIMGPVMERLVTENHKPLIELVDAYNEEQGFYDDLEVPETLQGQEIKITFNSIFHEAQKASGTRSIELLMASFANFSQLKPEILDLLNADKIGRLMAEKLSVSEVLEEDETIASIRQNRAQAQDEAHQAAQAQTQAQLAKTMAEAGAKQSSMDMRGGYGF